MAFSPPPCRLGIGFPSATPPRRRCCHARRPAPVFKHFFSRQSEGHFSQPATTNIATFHHCRRFSPPPSHDIILLGHRAVVAVIFHRCFPFESPSVFFQPEYGLRGSHRFPSPTFFFCHCPPRLTEASLLRVLPYQPVSSISLLPPPFSCSPRSLARHTTQ